MDALSTAQLALFGRANDEAGEGALSDDSDESPPLASNCPLAKLKTYVDGVSEHTMRKDGEHGYPSDKLHERYAGMYAFSMDAADGKYYAHCASLYTHPPKGDPFVCKKKTHVSLDSKTGALTFSNVLAHFRAVHPTLLRGGDRGKDKKDLIVIAEDPATVAVTPEAIAALRSVLVVFQLAGGLSENAMSSPAMAFLLRHFGHPSVPRTTFRRIKEGMRGALIINPVKAFLRNAQRKIRVQMGGISISFILKFSVSTDGWTLQRGVTLQSYIFHASSEVMGVSGNELRPTQIAAGFSQLPSRKVVRTYNETGVIPDERLEPKAEAYLPDDDPLQAVAGEPDSGVIDAGATAHAIDFVRMLIMWGVDISAILRGCTDSAAVMRKLFKHLLLKAGGPHHRNGAVPFGVIRGACMAHANNNAVAAACKLAEAVDVMAPSLAMSIFFRASFSHRGKLLQDEQRKLGVNQPASTPGVAMARFLSKLRVVNANYKLKVFADSISPDAFSDKAPSVEPGKTKPLSPREEFSELARC